MSATHCERDESEIEITPEMIKAGSKELAGWMASSVSKALREEIACDVYEVMRALEPKLAGKG